MKSKSKNKGLSSAYSAGKPNSSGHGNGIPHKVSGGISLQTEKVPHPRTNDPYERKKYFEEQNRLINIVNAGHRVEPIKKPSTQSPTINKKETSIVNSVINPLSLSHQIINIQEVVEILKQNPDIAYDFLQNDKLPFNECTFIFSDQDGDAICITGKNTKFGVEFEKIRGVSFDNLCRLAISLMNCKNITYTEYDPNHHLNVDVRPAVPFIRYKILHINPMTRKKVNRSEAPVKANDSPARAVRGHYMIGSPERPLFGKPWGVGRFWVGPHVTGNLKFGLVLHDYHLELTDLKSAIYKG